MRGIALRTSAVVVLLLHATAAWGNPQADRAVAEADARARAKDFLGAAAKFREAYRYDARPDIMCNIGVAYYKAQELPRAQLFLSRCLERGSALEPRYIDTVRATLSKIERTLHTSGYAPVDVVVEPAAATVQIESYAVDEVFEGSRTVWLPFGHERITVRAEGYVDQTIEVTPADRRLLQVHVSLAKQPEVAPKVDLDTAPPPPITKPIDEPRQSPIVQSRRDDLALESRPRHSRIPIIVASAATVAAIAVSILASTQAHDHADRARAALRVDDYVREGTSAHDWNVATVVGLGAAGVGAVMVGLFAL